MAIQPIESREEYFALIEQCNEEKKSILAVKTHIGQGLDMIVRIVGKIAKFRTIEDKPIAELDLTDGFITDKLDSNLAGIETRYTEIDAAFQTFLNQ